MTYASCHLSRTMRLACLWQIALLVACFSRVDTNVPKGAGDDQPSVTTAPASREHYTAPVDPRWRHAAPVDAHTVLLFNLRDEARADRLDLRDGALTPLDLSALSWPVDLAAGEGGLYAIDRRGSDLWLLRHEGATWRPLGEVGERAELLSRGGQAVLLVRDNGWSGHVLQGETRVPLFAELPDRPLDWGAGWRADEVAIARDGAAWFWRAGEEPAPWTEPPLLWSAPEWPESWIPLPDGTWLASGSWALHHVQGDEVTLVLRHGTGFRYPAEGPAGEAALGFFEPVFPLGDRLVFWEASGQRLLELQRAEGDFAVHTLWAEPLAPTPVDLDTLKDALFPPVGQWQIRRYRPVLEQVEAFAALPGALALAGPLLDWEPGDWQRWESRVLAWSLHDRAGLDPVWAPPADTPPPATLAEVLAAFAAEDWHDVDSETLAQWRLQHLPHLEVLTGAGPSGVTALLASDTAGAAYALAILGAPEGRARLEALVRDSTPRGWETGCTYPRSAVGQRALEQLTGRPVELSPQERRRYRALAAEAEGLEGMDAWCGKRGHARWLLGKHDRP